MLRRFWVALGIGLSAAGAIQCGGADHPPSLVLPEGGRTGDDAGGSSEGRLRVADAALDANLCGDQEIPAILDPPNLYFIVDRSGSMGEILPGSNDSKYQNAIIAISVMLRAVGHRVNYGAAVFPASADGLGCEPGMQVFPTEKGDPPSFAALGENGPVLTELLKRLGYIVATGGTPTASTLRALEPTVVGLTGKKTYVVLMTDGAPNCNTLLSCGIDGCIPNIERQTISGAVCDDRLNCCDPKVVGDAQIGYCVDADATEAAVASYEQGGVDTYVVGMPGTAQYGAVLNRLAVAGNTARTGSTAYYAVSDTSELADALKAIGAQVAITCDLPLTIAPPDPNQVNVYFDGQLVPNDARDGWHFSGDTSIQFQGASCDSLGSGNVLNVQVLAGCPTVVR